MRALLVLVCLGGGLAAAQPLKTTVGPLDSKRPLASTMDGFERVVVDNRFTAYGFEVELIEKRGKWGARVGGRRTTSLKSLPAVVTLGRGKAARAVTLARHGAVWTWSSHYGATFKLGKLTFAIVDADADGELWETGEDALLGPYSDTVSPWQGSVWSETEGWTISGDPPTAAAAPMPRPGKHDLNRGLAVLNANRQAAGIPPLGWDESVHEGCKAHIKYIQATGKKTHSQDEESEHYSEAGDDAARSGVMSFAYGTAWEAMLEQLSTAYHLKAVLAPESRKIGMAISGKVFVANAKLDRSGEIPKHPISWVWPAHGRQDVPRAFNYTGEIPMPLPRHPTNHKVRIGQAIVALIDAPDEEGQYSLILTDSKGKAVAGTLTSPSSPVKFAGTARDNARMVILAPDGPLAAATRYTATLEMKDGEGKTTVRVWHFTTGSKLHCVTCHGGGGGGRKGRRRP